MGEENKLKELEEKLATLEIERAKLIIEINLLRNKNFSPQRENSLSSVLVGTSYLENSPQTPQSKIDLFLKLFRCREDVYPKRWENSKTGKQGYSPACDLEWVKPICQKPTIKCSDCHHQKFSPLDEKTVESHLKGYTTIGTYAIKADDSCSFLACDFDESTWREDILAYKQAARELGIEAYLERSRSGKGGHAWIFFSENIPARIARSLGTLILAKCSEFNIRLSLDSYDRFFPSQDYLPKGGFGNLIALPLQKASRDQGNSCFIDSEFNVIADQWEYLAKARRLSRSELQSILDNHLPRIKVVSREDAFEDISWSTDQAILDKTTLEKIDHYLEDKTIEVTFGPQISIPLENLREELSLNLEKRLVFPILNSISSKECECKHIHIQDLFFRERSRIQKLSFLVAFLMKL